MHSYYPNLRASIPFNPYLSRCILTSLGLLFFLMGCSGTAPEAGSGPPAQAVAESTEVTAPTPAPPTLAPTATLPAAPTADPALEPAMGAETESRPEPQIGKITFALDATEDYQPVEPGILFTKGITEVHALFDYNDMAADYIWERVWYLNDKEVSRSGGPWAGPAQGTFDYFIDNGGNPLPAGEWLLEIYVEDELQAVGAFVIEAAPDDEANLPAVYALAYTKCDGDHHNIYVADTNGHNEQLLVTRGAGPSWTPDGGSIFFFGEEGVDRQARDGLEYVFDGLSSGLVVVSTVPFPAGLDHLYLFQSLAWKQGSARWARVSPDGGMVAFDAKPGGDYRLYFLGTEANQQFRYELPGEQADWSPDSRRVVYRSGRDGQTGLWISNRDDSGHVQLTGHGSDSFPAWSPDGATIVFSRDEGGNVDLYAVNVDGSNLRRLTDAPGHDTLPAFTPDGQIIFRSARTGQWAIWKMNGDGTDQTQIIADACVGQDWAYSRMDVLP